MTSLPPTTPPRPQAQAQTQPPASAQTAAPKLKLPEFKIPYERIPGGRKGFVLGFLGLAVGATAVWPILVGGPSAEPSIVLTPETVSTGALAPQLQPGGQGLPAPVAAVGESGWIATAYFRTDPDPTKTERQPFARWIDKATTFLSTDYLSMIPARFPLAAAGTVHEGIWTPPETGKRTLQIQAKPPRLRTPMACAVYADVGGTRVLSHPAVVVAGSPVTLVSHPFDAKAGVKIPLAVGTSCIRIDDAGKPSTMETDNLLGTTASVASSGQDTDPADTLGVGFTVMVAGADGSGARAIEPSEISHPEAGAPRSVGSSRPAPNMPAGTVNSGAVEAMLPLGWQIAALPYSSTDWIREEPKSKPLRGFRSENSVITTRDHYAAGETAGGPFVYLAAANLYAAEPGPYQFAVAFSAAVRRSSYLDCAASLHLDGVRVFDGVSTAGAAGSGLVHGAVDLKPGVHVAAMRLACQPAGDHGLNLQDNGLFAPGETGAVFRFLMKSPSNDSLRPPLKGEVFQGAPGKVVPLPTGAAQVRPPARS